MDYLIKFTDNNFEPVEDWVEELKIDFKFQIGEKIIITHDSFESTLFKEDEDGGNKALDEVIELLNSTATDKDSIATYDIGYYIFIISDIEYVFLNNGVYGRIYLSKYK